MGKFDELKHLAAEFNDAEDRYWKDLDQKISEIKPELLKYLQYDTNASGDLPNGFGIYPVSVGLYDGEKVVNKIPQNIEREGKEKTVDISIVIFNGGSSEAREFCYSITFKRERLDYICEDDLTIGRVVCDETYANFHVFHNLYEKIYHDIRKKLDAQLYK